MANLSQLEPYRTIFIVIKLGLLAMSWFKLYRQPVNVSRARRVPTVRSNGAIPRRQRLISGASRRYCYFC